MYDINPSGALRTICLAAIVGCSSGTSPKALGAKSVAAAPSPADGWEVLFDGNSLDSWRGHCSSEVPSRWSIEGDTLHFSAAGPEASGGTLVSVKTYADFELSLQWKISEGGNSGIFYRGQEQCGNSEGPTRPLYESAPEMQVLDNKRHPDAHAGLGGNRQAGSLYDLIPASPQSAKPAGQWNYVRIVLDNHQVEHWLNGQMVVDYELGSSQWRALCASSKFKNWPNFVNPAERGHLGLQDHGDDVWYRNIRIRPL